MADGYIEIDTELATDKFDRQVMALQKKIEKLEKKDVEITANAGDLQNEIKKYEDLTKQVEQAKRKLEELKAMPKELGSVPAGPYLTELNQAKLAYDNLLLAQVKQQTAMEQAKSKLSTINAQHREITAEVETYASRIRQIRLDQHAKEVEKVKSGFKSVGSSLQDAVKKAGRLVLGIFAVRSAYSALRRASSELASYDKQYGANLEYIRFMLTQAIAPVLRWIVNMAYKVLQIIQMIVNALFGVNIFGKASVKNFQKMKASAGGTSKAVKEIKKQLAGFDEMNVLQDDKDTGGGGAGGGGVPGMDLSQMQGEVPAWLQWIKDNRELVLGFLAGLLAFILAINMGLGLIKSLGIGLMVWGIVTAVLSLLEYLKEPTWENFGKIIQGIGIFIIGLGVAFLGLPAIVVGVCVLIVGTIMKYWEQIKTYLQGKIDWLYSMGDRIRERFGNTIGDIYIILIDTLQGALNWVDNIFKSIRGIFDGFIMFFKGVFTGNWKMAWEGLKKIVSNAIKLMKTVFMDGFNLIMSMVLRIGERVGETLWGAFKGVVNAVLGTVEGMLNKPISAINGLIDKVNTIPGVSLTYLDAISLPRMKMGGIVNMPNRGSLIGGAIAGESGAEGVIPLTDSQAMETLGEAIGRYITINANIVNKMNGRILSRELKQISNDRDFAYNS